MQRKLIVTNDGSHSFYVPGMNVTYHSVHGAIQESMHVFIEAGLHALDRSERHDALRIFEMGFGTGLNALLTLIESEQLNQNIYYETIEAFPLNAEEAKLLNYCDIVHRHDLQKIFERLHKCEWGEEIILTARFTFKKVKSELLDFHASGSFDLIFFDAFDPNAQPELWTEEVFKMMFVMLKPGGILTTYSSKGAVRRVMQAVGFQVEKIPGPPGKREIVRAVRVDGLFF